MLDPSPTHCFSSTMPPPATFSQQTYLRTFPGDDGENSQGEEWVWRTVKQPLLPTASFLEMPLSRYHGAWCLLPNTCDSMSLIGVPYLLGDRWQWQPKGMLFLKIPDDCFGSKLVAVFGVGTFNPELCFKGARDGAIKQPTWCGPQTPFCELSHQPCLSFSDPSPMQEEQVCCSGVRRRGGGKEGFCR